ncbi:hypothetical protein C2S51_013138 [Perilla frutescens var. frutescens]|nr:hypothetical protein C2S51_013138 [Perilla frutescens var. frutescens]
METVVVRPESRRGRKRKINNIENATVGGGGKKKVVNTRAFELVGRYVQKEFQGSEVLLGRIMNYDSGLYRINYEDGRTEDLISRKVKTLLVEDGELFGEWDKRKEMLNELLSSKDVNLKAATADDTRELKKANPIDSSSLSGVTKSCTADDGVVKVHNDGKDDVDADISSGSCECAREEVAKLDVEVQLVPPPQLPPSSGDIGVPEEYVPYLLSVYSFLRSFSVRLFLYPFELDGFVGALNCSVANTLLDSVHVALMCFLKRQFEKLPSDGSELASKVLGCLDWSLLDTLTWPIYLAHYLMAIGYKNGDDWKELFAHCLERDYYTLSAGKKLIILQILCDGVLDTEELRAEMDMREESEVGIDIDTTTELGSCETARVHPRYSKTSGGKDIDATQRDENHHCMESQVGRAIEDDNGDECRLCGMDGVLVCCDGCPSAYHSRCLGLNKVLVSNGSWYCPECKVNASDPKILRGTTLRGGDVFGVDPYKQVFVASCDHLLVVKTSITSESCPRYYNRHCIPGVLNALYAKPEYASVYSEICRGIMQYWELSTDLIPSEKKSGIGLKLSNKEGGSLCTSQLVTMRDKVPEMTEVGNHGTCATGTSAEMAGSWHGNCVSDSFLDTMTISDCHADSTREQCKILKTTMTEATQSRSLIGQLANPCASSQQSNSKMTEAVSTRSSNISSVNDTSLEAKGSLISQELNNRVGNGCGSPSGWSLYMGSSFNRTGYINHYLHGDFSASAAANLAILLHEENKVLEHSSDNRQEVMCASIALQVKAFSSAAVRFFWLNVEKKLAEVPRERCSWCYSCKSPVTSKRGCLLNAAASNATRGAMKVLSGVRPVKNGGDERLSGIATYIMFMEESLSGLLVGPFLNDTFRKQWHRQLEQATTCSDIKILLLELEENMRPIALSGDWTKLVECFSSPSSTSQIATVSTQKCKPGRRGKKQPDMVEVVTAGFQKKLTDFTWWRGGIMSKLMFQRGILPSSIIKKPARQGGKKKIAGIRYVEGNEIPRISRQLVWRSAVEISRTVAHLALQVRYLDIHVRWGDLSHPEQMLIDGKCSEAEVSAFRNAFICGKKIVEQEVRYCVAFGSRKHLPSRVMKNVAEVEKILEDGKERYWFSETFIPLYLIREYEQKVEKHKSVNVLSKLQRRQLKASRENIFSFLSWKQGNTVPNCCSCHQDVFYRNAAKCHACQGFCHQQCATTSTVTSEEINFLVICKKCREAEAATQVDSSSNGSPTSPLLIQGQGVPNPAITKNGNLVCCKGPSSSSSSSSFGALKHSSEVKSINRKTATKKNTKSNWGLVWRKNYCEDTGFDFRLRNILLRGNTDRDSIKPLCRLCDQPYNADLMYIRCDTCKHWYHADSVELDESKIFSLVGFKCCKCRRIKSPVCPYLDPLKKNALKDKVQHLLASKLEIFATGFNRGMIPDHHKEVPITSESPRKAEGIHASAANARRFTSPHEAKQCTESKPEGSHGWNSANVSDPEPRKLPVRRHVNREKDILGQADPFQFEESSTFEANVVSSTEDMSMRRSTRLATNSLTNPAVASAAISEQKLLPSRLQHLASNDCFDLESNVNVKGPPESATGDREISSSVPGNGTPPQVSHNQEKLMRSAETSNQIVACKFCSKTEPWPDLSCPICDITIHKLCSPWFESSSHEDGWRCGGCRDWS